MSDVMPERGEATPMGAAPEGRLAASEDSATMGRTVVGGSATPRDEAVVAGAVRAQGCGTALHVEHLSFTHEGASEPVLDDVSLEVPSGAFALLVGDTGSGKSTLLSLVKPQIAPAGMRSGEVRVLGAPVASMDDAEAAQAIGFVFQDPESQIVCDSVWREMAFGLENLGVPQEVMRRRVAETCYFLGMDAWFDGKTDELSGGRKQLLALASVLAMRPRLLLLDEPTSQLDPIAAQSLLHAVFRINRELGCTVLVATHEPHIMVDYATCAFRLEGGRVEPVADIEDLRHRPPLFEAAEQGGAGAVGAGAYDFGVDGGAPVVGSGHGVGAPQDGGSALTPDAFRPSASLAHCVLAEGGPHAASSEAAAELSRVWFRYGRAGAWVLRGLDLTVASASIHALVGGNGCGKSTLLGLMAGTLDVRRGHRALHVRERALLPQDPCALFAAETVRDELMEWGNAGIYGLEEADAMLERLGLTARRNVHPFDLSGGQRQLLALGKVLLLHPRLLLLDEPTKGLDASARRLMARLLVEERAAGSTVVLASHDLDFVAQLADTVSMVFDGEVACTEPTDVFFRDNILYRP